MLRLRSLEGPRMAISKRVQNLKIWKCSTPMPEISGFDFKSSSTLQLTLGQPVVEGMRLPIVELLATLEKDVLNI